MTLVRDDDTAAVHAADEMLLGFTVALRAAGVAATHDRAQAFLGATAISGLEDPLETYYAGRATLCGSPADLDRFDLVYDAYFNARAGLPRPGLPMPPVVRRPASILPLTGAQAGEDPEDDQAIPAMASASEVLRHRDVADLSVSEKQRLVAMFATLEPRPPLRRGARRQPWRHGSVDARRTLRASLRRMGEPAVIEWRRLGRKARPVVLLVDVSGSMQPYAEALLRLSHRISRNGRTGGRVEVFSAGTRLTHLTKAMSHRDPEQALAAAGRTVPDWSGGTRLGETMKVFLDRWGQRGMARGAVVVVFSDGWELGDAVMLGEQMARMRRIAHRVIWVNPHRGKSGYEPIQRGVMAVLPHVDDFVAGHSMATFAELIEVIARA